MASVEVLSIVVTAATVLTTLSIFVLIGLVIRDWRNGSLW